MHDHQDASEAYSRGLEYLEYNEPDQAILAFTETLKLNPRHMHAYFARGCAGPSGATFNGRLPTTTRSYVSIQTMRRPTAIVPMHGSVAATPRPPRPIWNVAEN